jgi:hypothetical protein
MYPVDDHVRSMYTHELTLSSVSMLQVLITHHQVEY